ncbi:MAG: hypothetical protein ACYDAJ_12175 [Nitrosotalea sp.]
MDMADVLQATRGPYGTMLARHTRDASGTISMIWRTPYSTRIQERSLKDLPKNLGGYFMIPRMQIADTGTGSKEWGPNATSSPSCGTQLW